MKSVFLSVDATVVEKGGRRLRKIAMLTLMMAGVAGAAPLLGTSRSFFESSFCRAYHCAFTSREPLTSNIVDYRYRLAPSGDATDESLPTLSVIRINNVVTSIGFATGAQDDLLSPGSNLARMWTSVVSLATGTAASQASLIRLERACEAANGAESTLRLAGFTVGCVNTGGEFQGARRVAFRVYR